MTNNSTMQQVALITGASSGIGYATALAFARHGTNVVAIARRAERLTQLERQINQLPGGHGEALTVIADVRNPADMERAVQQALQRFERLDILVANAGIGHRGSISDANWSDLVVLDRGLMWTACCTAFGQQFRRLGRRVVVMSS